VILWVFALHFDNYRLHHKELQLQCCRHEPLYRNLQATEISKLRLIIALDVVYIWLIVFILTSYTVSSLQLGYFMTKKTDKI